MPVPRNRLALYTCGGLVLGLVGWYFSGSWSRATPSASSNPGGEQASSEHFDGGSRRLTSTENPTAPVQSPASRPTTDTSDDALQAYIDVLGGPHGETSYMIQQHEAALRASLDALCSDDKYATLHNLIEAMLATSADFASHGVARNHAGTILQALMGNDTDFVNYCNDVFRPLKTRRCRLHLD